MGSAQRTPFFPKNFLCDDELPLTAFWAGAFFAASCASIRAKRHGVRLLFFYASFEGKRKKHKHFQIGRKDVNFWSNIINPHVRASTFA